jgi:DNA invertase Pin-like site-specific DNA recombinase
VSAFRGDNARQGHLAAFVQAVELGTVPAGSVLIVESLDRISRQGIDEGYNLCKWIIKKGILLGTLQPEREFGPEALKRLSQGSLELQRAKQIQAALAAPSPEAPPCEERG